MLIKVKVIPFSSKDKIIKKSEYSFEIYVKQKPIQGKANASVVSILSKYLQIPKKDIKITKGFKTRNKIFKLKI